MPKLISLYPGAGSLDLDASLSAADLHQPLRPQKPA